MANEKNSNNPPVKIAPMTLVAANSIANKTTDNKMVPKMPANKTGNTPHRQTGARSRCTNALANNATARYTTAIPNTTHKNAGVTVITAVKRRKATTIPMMMLEITDRPTQLLLQSQPNIAIIHSPPLSHYMPKKANRSQETNKPSTHLLTRAAASRSNFNRSPHNTQNDRPPYLNTFERRQPP